VLEFLRMNSLISGIIIISYVGNIHNTDLAFQSSVVIPLIKLLQIKIKINTI